MANETGTNGSDVLDGGSGNDVLQGLGGDDVLNGYAGNDAILGGEGHDVIVGGPGNDGVNGGGGSDTLMFYEDADVFINLDPGWPNVNKAIHVGYGTDTFTQVENFWTAGGNDGIIGNDQANHLLSGAGEDGLYGQGGNDWLNGGQDDDTLYGGSGADYLEGSSGDDVIVGGSQNDDIDGGTGVDTLTGGSGADDFVFEDGDSGVGAGDRDVITDFAPGYDDLDLTAFGGLDFVGQDAFSATDQVRYSHSGGNTFVSINTDAGLGTDMQIQLNGIVILNASDFVL